MMAPSPVEPAVIHDYHVHVYYDPDSRDRAAAVADVGGGTFRQSAWDAGTTCRSGPHPTRDVSDRSSRPTCFRRWCRSS